MINKNKNDFFKNLILTMYTTEHFTETTHLT